jgi:hypothetical protein
MELPISSMLTLRIDTWRDARILADDLSLWVFRGQENAEWDLSTGIQRAGTLGKEQSAILTNIESQVIHDFQRRAAHFITPLPAPEEVPRPTYETPASSCFENNHSCRSAIIGSTRVARRAGR